MELMEDLDPEEARAIVDPALKLMIDAVHRYNGYIVQSTGDGISALFGAPAAYEDHSRRALYAALRMQEDLRRYADELRQQGRTPVQVRVGVNTGEVVVRSIHTGDWHAEYTPIGHSTGLAARLQALANPGAVVIGESLRRAAEGYFQLKALGRSRIKGVNDPVELFEVTGVGPLRTRLQIAARRGLTKFVGREAELEQMRRTLELAGKGHGQILAAIGEPGVGKSRLFFEFKAVAQSGCLVLEAYSVSHGKASAYLPVVDLLGSYFNIGLEDEVRQRREKVIGRLLGLDRSLEDTLPYVFALLGINEGDDALAQMDAQIRRRRTHESLKRIWLRESRNQTSILIFEDLHWIDEETQSLLNLLADSIANARILLAVNYRPEYRHEWGSRTHYTQLRLGPLAGANADTMLDALLGDAGELAPVKQMVVRRSQGNPFFIEEIIQALFDESVLVRNGAVRVARDLSLAHLPATVQGILAARIDRLPPEERELLQTLAVIGKEFPLGLVLESTGLPTDELEQVLRHLQLGEFIHEQPVFPEVQYSFKHALTQEVAYNSVLSERRRMLHGRIGSAMEKLYAGGLDDYLPELAHHFARSADTLKAVEYLLKAGHSAMQRSTSREALDRFELALRLLEDVPSGSARDEQELAIRAGMTMPLSMVRGFATPDVEINLKRARELCEQTDAPFMLAFQVLQGLSTYYSLVADFEAVRSLADRILRLGAKCGDAIVTSNGYFDLGGIYVWTGEYRAAVKALQQGIDIYTRSLPGSEVATLPVVMFPFIFGQQQLSWMLWILGYPEQALRQIDRMHALPEQLRAKSPKVQILNADLEIRCFFIPDYRGGRDKAQAVIAQARENGFGFLNALGAVHLGRVMVQEGEIEEGIKAINEGVEAIKATGEIPGTTWNDYALAEAFLTAGRAADGLAAVNRAIAAAEQFQINIHEAEAHRLKGELLLLSGAPQAEAEASMRRAIATAQRQEAKGWELRAATSLARLLRKQGRIAEARDALAQVYNWFTEGFEFPDLKDAKALLDDLNN
jgi:class 3 adenylate cyclase